MDFFETVMNRHSVRQYESDEISEEEVQKILETIDLAPSAGDLQAYEVIVARDHAVKSALASAAYGQPYVASCPVVMIFCADHLMSAGKYGDRGATLYAIQDATIAATYCQLAATALGLATVWVGAFNPAAVKDALQIPDHISPVAIIPIGHPAEVPARPFRKPLSDLVRSEKF